MGEAAPEPLASTLRRPADRSPVKRDTLRAGAVFALFALIWFAVGFLLGWAVA
jgi:uncharacterized membrane protein YccC